MLVVRRAYHRATRSRIREFNLGNIGSARGCQPPGNGTASSCGTISADDRLVRRGCRLRRVYFSLRRSCLLVALARRSDQRTPRPEYCPRRHRRLAAPNRVASLGAVEERNALDVALLHARSLEQHLACLRIDYPGWATGFLIAASAE